MKKVVVMLSIALVVSFGFNLKQHSDAQIAKGIIAGLFEDLHKADKALMEAPIMLSGSR